MGVSGIEGVDVNWGNPVAGLRSGRNYCSIGIFTIKCTRAIRIQKV